MLCAKFGWNWPSGSGEEDENVKRLQTDGRTQTTCDQKSSTELSAQVRLKERDRECNFTCYMLLQRVLKMVSLFHHYQTKRIQCMCNYTTFCPNLSDHKPVFNLDTVLLSENYTSSCVIIMRSLGNFTTTVPLSELRTTSYNCNVISQKQNICFWSHFNET